VKDKCVLVFFFVMFGSFICGFYEGFLRAMKKKGGA